MYYIQEKYEPLGGGGRITPPPQIRPCFRDTTAFMQIRLMI
jgi:hypothetical protein